MAGPIVFGGVHSHGQTLGTVDMTVSGFTFELLELDIDDIMREAIEATNMNVLPTTTDTAFGNRIYIPSAYVDPGKLMLSGNHDPTQMIPINEDSEPIDVFVGPSAADQEQFSVALGFMTRYRFKGPMDGKVMTADMEIKLTDDDSYDATGAVAWTAAS